MDTDEIHVLVWGENNCKNIFWCVILYILPILPMGKKSNRTKYCERDY